MQVDTSPRRARRWVRDAVATTSFVLAFAIVWPAVAPATTRYLSPGGSDAGSCGSAASACRTIGFAYDRAEAGDVVRVAAGSYGSQDVHGTKSSPGVVFDLDPAAHFAKVKVEATWVEFRNGRIDDFGWWTEARNPVPSNVTFVNITAREASFNGGRDIKVLGGRIGDHTAPTGVSAAFSLYGDGAELSNVVVDRVDFHDIGHAVDGDHFEAVRIDTGAHDITIRNSRFRNITANSSVIFVDNTYGDPGDPYNLTLENNFFASPRGGPGGGAYFVFNMNANVGTCQSFAFRYNSFASTPANLLCARKSNVSWIGNVAPKPPGCDGNTFSHNVWQATSSSTRCSSTDKWVRGPQYSPSRLGFVDAAAGDLHLTRSSPANGAGVATSAPAKDIDCGARSGSAIPDAGADEFGVAGSCASSTARKPKKKKKQRCTKRVAAKRAVATSTAASPFVMIAAKRTKPPPCKRAVKRG